MLFRSASGAGPLQGERDAASEEQAGRAGPGALRAAFQEVHVRLRRDRLHRQTLSPRRRGLET